MSTFPSLDSVQLRGSLGNPNTDKRGPVPCHKMGLPGAIDWFPEAHINYAKILVEGSSKSDDALALLPYTKRSATPVNTSYGDLGATVAQLRAGLEADGVKAGNRVAGVVANNADAFAAILAAKALGASWSSTSPDFRVLL